MGNNTDNQIDVAIIGAGMAGLSAAVHVRHSGLSVKVFEQHYIPGGLYRAWKMSGYIFDYCIDYLKQFEDLKNTSKA